MLEAVRAANSTRANQRAVFVLVVSACLNRQRPFGKADWQADMASMFGLGSTLRPRGRPPRYKAIGGLGVVNEYRDGAQSTSVVCRNQLWDTFSVVFVLHTGARLDVSVARPVVSFFS